MRVGDSLQELSPRNIFESVVPYINLTHQAGFCHRDLRRANLVSFNGNVQLVDYGEAVPVGSDQEVKRGGAREEVLPRSVKEVEEGANYEWTKANDFEMLALALLPPN